MKHNCTHNPLVSQFSQNNHSNPVAFPYPPDPLEHVLERSVTPKALVNRDKLDLSSLAPPKGEMESSFCWTYLFKSPTSSTLCLLNLHLESSPKLNCCVIPYQALYVTSHLESSIKRLSSISPNILLLFILELHSLCQNLLQNKPTFRHPLQLSDHSIF